MIISNATLIALTLFGSNQKVMLPKASIVSMADNEGTTGCSLEVKGLENAVVVQESCSDIKLVLK